MQSSEQYRKEHGRSPGQISQAKSDNDLPSDFFERDDGRFEFSGNELPSYTIPDDIKNRMICLDAPNLTGTLDLSQLPALKTINAPQASHIGVHRCDQLDNINIPRAKKFVMSHCGNVQNVHIPSAVDVVISRCHNLTSIEALKADRVIILECQALTMVNAPNVRDFNADLTTLDTLIKAVNPQKIETFNVRKDIFDKSMSIFQDIKSAHRDLNEDGYVEKQNNEAQFDTFIGATQGGNRFANTLLGTMDNRHPEEGAKIFGKIMDYAGSKHKDLAVFNRKALLGYEVNQRCADEKIEEYKKQNIVAKTREIASGRGIQL
jgi:hypothetical protein